MITRDEARARVMATVNLGVEDDSILVLDDETIEKEYGWIFFYTSRRFHETGDVDYALAGNGPVVVEREGGTVHALGTARAPDDEIRAFEQRLSR